MAATPLAVAAETTICSQPSLLCAKQWRALLREIDNRCVAETIHFRVEGDADKPHLSALVDDPDAAIHDLAECLATHWQDLPALVAQVEQQVTMATLQVKTGNCSGSSD